MTGFKLLPAYKDLFDEAAKARGITFTEFTRRALFVAVQHPELLDEADSDEAEYSSNLGSSRWHATNE